MTRNGSVTVSAAVRERLGHPVIDADGHTVEFLPAMEKYLVAAGAERRMAGGLDIAAVRKRVNSSAAAWVDLTPEERVHRRAVKGTWWGLNADALDLATVSLPRLMRARLDEMGIDGSVVYGSIGRSFGAFEDESVRRAGCRGVNRYYAESFAPYSDRLIPVAVIPMHTPEEAVDELEYAAVELGMRAAVFQSYVKRPIPALEHLGPDVSRYAYWLDLLGIDSRHDYDPVWKRCQELGVPVAAHSLGIGWGSRRSISSYVYNHVGHFAAIGEAFAKALFLGGVPHRFPGLNFAFLEGGVGWAVSLLSDLVGHWSKRNGEAVERYGPEGFDKERFGELLREYGEGWADLEPRGALGIGWGGEAMPHSLRDEWAACAIESVGDILRVYTGQYFFGCEADDPLVSLAFSEGLLPLGAKVKPLFSSDIGHWDVPDVREVLAEGFENVEEGRIVEADFREFAFVNPALLYCGMNPHFFDGTRVQSAVDQLLRERSAAGPGEEGTRQGREAIGAVTPS